MYVEQRGCQRESWVGSFDGLSIHLAWNFRNKLMARLNLPSEVAASHDLLNLELDTFGVGRSRDRTLIGKIVLNVFMNGTKCIIQFFDE